MKKAVTFVFEKAVMLSLAIIFLVGMIGTISKLCNKAHAEEIVQTTYGSGDFREKADDENLTDVKHVSRWRFNKNGYSQRYTALSGNRLERMKGLLDAYGLDSEEVYPAIQTIARIHSVKPEAIICISYADSSLGKYLKTKNNFGNVGNNDRGDKVSYTNMEKGWNAIGKTLNNKYLSYIYTIDYLSRYHNKTGKVYATSEENQFVNLANCLGMLNEANTGVADNFQFRF